MSMTDRHIQNWVGSRCDSRRAQSPARDQAERLVVREIYILIAELRKDPNEDLANAAAEKEAEVLKL